MSIIHAGRVDDLFINLDSRNTLRQTLAAKELSLHSIDEQVSHFLDSYYKLLRQYQHQGAT